jgi:hypothetical protein
LCGVELLLSEFDLVGRGCALRQQLAVGGEGGLRLLDLVLGGGKVGLLGEALFLRAAMLHVVEPGFGAVQSGLGGGDAAGGVGGVHAQELLTFLYLLVEMNVELRNDAGVGSVRLEVDDGLNLAVGGNGAGEVPAADRGDADRNLGSATQVEENHDHKEDREQCPEPSA